ncbi:putative disrupted in schizophrenia 1 protein-like [Triplophysa rosa]|uniref:Disrupted in schizophrenia 1 protein-like n=1 Tax=Triplophysa rosa TaxID=992332 RepID=A0A9W7WVW1_TRIRA|nr:putative disrupted in schizophrenia 1 protein-like [Triplophysa rosa]
MSHGPIVTGFPLTCKLCPNNLLPDDGHEFCPSCLGIQHLKDALTDPCVHCSLLPLSERRLRLAELDPNSTVHLGQADPAAQRLKKCCASATTSAPPSKKETALSKMVAVLSSEMMELKRLLHSLQQPVAPVDPMQDDGVGIDPGQKIDEEYAESLYLSRHAELDVLSTSASDSLFHGKHVDGTVPPSPQEVFAEVLAAEVSSGRSVRTTEHSQATSDDTLAVLRMAVAHLGLDTAVQATQPNGLGAPPEVEQPVAALVVSTDEALRGNVRCPSAQCGRTDSLLKKAYDSTAYITRTENTICQLLLATTSSLESADVDPSISQFLQTALMAMGHVTRELGALTATLFGSPPTELLEKRVKLSETTRQLTQAPRSSTFRAPMAQARRRYVTPEHRFHQEPTPQPRGPQRPRVAEEGRGFLPPHRQLAESGSKP